MSTEIFDCGSGNGSIEFALPRPYPCCGWNIPPSSISGTYVCYADPPSDQFGCNVTSPTAFSLPIVTYCSIGGFIYKMPDGFETFPFNAGVLIQDCPDPAGASPPHDPLMSVGFIDAITLPSTFNCTKDGFLLTTGNYSFVYGDVTYYVNVTINGATF